MNFYSKEYVSIGGYKCKMWYHFSVKILFNKSRHDKLFGYWYDYYDGYYHWFSLYPFAFSWWKMPITSDRLNKIKPKK